MHPPIDLILIQEPYFGRIGTNPQMAQGNPIYDIYSGPKHKDWQAIYPQNTSKDNHPDVMLYVPAKRTNWTYQLRSDIISAPHIMCLEVTSASFPIMVFNVYNDVDNSAVEAMKTIQTMHPHTIFLGDFNLHHPIWSRDDNLSKHNDKADELAHLFSSNNFGLLNQRGEETFFVYRHLEGRQPELYTSTLDLGWASPHLLPLITNFQVAKHLCNGSDHYPLLTQISYTPGNPARQTFVFTEEKFDNWAEQFELELSTRPEIPEIIYTEEEFNVAVESLQQATLAACQKTCLRRVKPAKAARWWDSKVREALRELREARKSLTRLPNNHNALRYHVSRKRFHWQVKLAKRSHARHFCSTVQPGTDLWKLNSWYKGVRKTTVPTLKDPSSDPKFPIWVSESKDKASLLANSWFPNKAPRTTPVPHPQPRSGTRPFTSVTNEEIMDSLNDTSNTSAPGLSGLNYKVWKWVATVAPEQFIAVIRAAIHLGVHHPSWKKSMVVVIPKNNKKDMALPKSHRPIQLIECLGKLVEKIIAKRITFELGKHKLMPFNQFGGRSNSSCLDAGLSLTHDIQTAREKGLVSSFLAVDVKGFFDHVDHKRLIDVLEHKGFATNIVSWVKSFTQDRFVRVQVDDYVGDEHPQLVGVPQGSPVSPVLACIYSSVVLEDLNLHPIFDDTGPASLPVAPRAYVDDIGFLAVSHDLETNIYTLRKTLERAADTLTNISMSIDPDKCDLQHFSWRRSPPDGSPSLKTSLYGKNITITPPSSIRWLGFHLDRQLTFTQHVNLLAKKGFATVQGLKVLGNTIEGISPSNLRLLYKTVVIPAITYGSQLWFNPSKPQTRLVSKLEQVQHKALIQIAGGFYDSQQEALQLLTYVPPIRTTLHKLYRSAALRIPRLPTSSEITRRLPVAYLPRGIPLERMIIPPKHIPFPRPKEEHLSNDSYSPLNRMVATFDKHTERAEPFHTQNTPYHLCLTSLPFAGRLFIESDACPKAERKSLIAQQRVWLNTREGRQTLCVFTDGSKTDKAAGWAITGIHAGRVLFTHNVPFAERASSHDAEMMAQSHASKLILETMLGKPDIREFRIFSDSTSALKSIFSPAPHPAQQASFLFRSNMFTLFNERKDIKGTLLWTPGHGGLDHMDITDKNARAAANRDLPSNQYFFPLFVSRSAALTEVETMALKEWHDYLNKLEDDNKLIFRKESGFKPFADKRKTSTFLRLRPPSWFKLVNRSLMSQLTQMCTNHAPTGEYFKTSVYKYRDKPPSFFHCPCKSTGNYPPVLQTREHILRACPLFEEARNRLRAHVWWIDRPKRSIGGLVRKKTIEHTLEYLKSGPFSRKHAPHEPP